jgi:hypothetical protein
VERGFGDDGAVTDLPWASVFDPTANARALSAIQAEGFRAASQLVDRFVRIATASVAPPRESTTPADHTTNGDRPGYAGNLDIEGLIKMWWSATGQFLLQSSSAAAAALRPPARLDLRNADATGQVGLEVTKPDVAATEIWLHNNGFDDLGAVRPRCSELLSHDGFVIGSPAIWFEPELVPMPRRSSRGLRMNVNVADDVPAGQYRGTLLVDGHPDLWLPVALLVLARGS